jgi:hypothetical protein
MNCESEPTNGNLTPKLPRLLKVIACEIAFREICHLAARSPNLHDLEFLTQGHHDVPSCGREEVQKRIDAVPAGKYEGILIGYGLCSSILTGLRATHLPLVVPRAHDCITFFLGSKERYQQCFADRPGTYYYTSGWLECARRRGLTAGQTGGLLPLQGVNTTQAAYAQWVAKYGEEKAKYLLEAMGEWTANYTHGVLIGFDFSKPLNLRPQVEAICADRGWQFEGIPGDLGLLQRWLDGDWNDKDFLVVQPGQQIAPSYDDRIIAAEPATPGPTPLG